jgi:prohibitin 1
MADFRFDRERVVDVGDRRTIIGAGAAVLAVAVAVLVWASVAYVPAGHVGVLTIFGRVTNDVLPEGTHVVNPFKANNKITVRTQELKENASVPSNEGLIITMEASLLFRVSSDKAPDLYRTVGPNYISVVVEPNLRSAIREVTASHSANVLYSSEREKVAQEMSQILTRELDKRGITVENILLRDIQLPQTLKTSIEAKQQAEQESLAMSFRLQKEKQEAERKRIEAQGIRDFQQIVAQGISAQLLQWKGIEATEKLASSTNSKVVVIGNSQNGLPLILGQ